jgi:hypothetical protein
MCNILTLFLLESPLAFLLILEQDCTLTGLGAIRVLADLDGFLVEIVLFKEGHDIFSLYTEGQSTHLQSTIVGCLHYISIIN